MSNTWSIVAVLALSLLTTSARAASPECFDLAVIAHVRSNTPTPLDPNDHGLIVRWPWIAELDVEQVLLGSMKGKHLRTVQQQHAGYDPAYQHVLFLIRRAATGSYSIVDTQPMVLRDAQGKFAIPLIYPWILHAGWNTPEFVAAAKPITYRPADAWWLDRWNESDVKDAAQYGVVFSGRRALATKAVYLDDLIRIVGSKWKRSCQAQ